MGDVSHEPSMEEILASIKRIIAEDGEGAPAARRTRSQRPQSEPAAEPEEEGVLELTDRIDEPASSPAEPASASSPRPAQSEPDEVVRADPIAASSPRALEEEPVTEQPSAPDVRSESTDEAPPVDQPLVSEAALAASRQSIAQLSQLIVKPEAPGPGTLEALVREMLRPMLKDWLDARLPDLVEHAVRREIARIVEQR